MARIRFVAAIVLFGGAAAASFAACTSNNPSFINYSTGSSTGATSSTGTTSGAGTGTSGGASTGTASTGKAGTGTSGSTAANDCGPSRYFNEEAGACMCAGNAYMTKDSGATCICQSDVPTLCDYDAGQMPQCVDTTTDNGNCGGCGISCGPTESCNNSKCGKSPSQLVPPAAGCISTRVVYDSGNIYWEDLGHGTIKSIPAGGDGGAVTTIASGLTIAAVQTPDGPLSWPSGPLATSLLVHAGTVYWIAAATPVFCPTDGGLCSGGSGTTIMSMSATGVGTPKTVLKMSMDPPASPVSGVVDAGLLLETPGQSPPILTMTLSPDGNTIYFAAGTRFYSIPSAGGAAPVYVTYAEGPEHGEATALAADTGYLYYPANESGNVEINSITTMCDPVAAGNEMCPVRIAESQGSLVYDTVLIRGSLLYWGNGQSIRVGNVQVALGGMLAGDDYPNALEGSNVTGFAIGTQYGYFGETGQDGVGYIEKGANPLLDGGTDLAVMVARGQPQPMSFALDGTNVYWTTTNCDINYIADSPQ